MVKARNFPNRIQNTMLLYFLSSVLMFVLALGVVLYWISKNNLEQEMGRRLNSVGTVISSSIPTWSLAQIKPEAVHSRTYKNIQDLLLTAVPNIEVGRVYITDLNHRLLVDSKPNSKVGIEVFEHQLYKDEWQIAVNGKAAATPLFKGEDGTVYKKSFAPVFQGSDVVAVIGVEASADFFDSLDELKSLFFYSLVILSLIITFVAIFIAKRIVHPLENLVGVVKRIGMGDLDTKVVLPYMNEIGLLGSAVDDMRMELKEKDDRMQIVLRGIAHEIRNPLGGIELFAGLLKEDLNPKRDGEKIQAVSRILQEVKNLKGIIEQFLNFARQQLPVLQNHKSDDLLREIIEACELTASEKNVRLTTHIDKSWETLYIDGRLMKQALLNLVINAIQAVEKNTGIVSVRIYDPEESGIQVALQVEDNGSGIEKSVMPQVFRPFFTTKSSGSGLGLAFAQKIVAAHGGFIRVASQAGEGTRMTILLPHAKV